jgi:hypothetical protein
MSECNTPTAKPCGCSFSDAMRCADHRTLPRMWCNCQCHKSPADPIRAAITKAQGDLAADLEVVAVLCPNCKTELAFVGDVCGLCEPGAVPKLQ